ncbi:MAG: sigma-70 family RNA polymerase sigma factor [Planctomycetes bacterium]|nr:sigma-70 family RNA polymerase sigma factor [Planctomycetota bacterium]
MSMQSAVDQTTRLLGDVVKGDPSAAARLLPLVYDELRSLAAAYFRRQPDDHTLQPTALVHEAYMRLVNHATAQWQDRAHFFAVAATAMRQILVNHALAQNAEKRGGGRTRIALAEDLAPTSQREFDPIALDEAIKKLAALDARKASVVDLRFFGGLSVDEAAVVLNVSKTTVEADWRLARAWLSKELSGGMTP